MRIATIRRDMVRQNRLEWGDKEKISDVDQ